MRYFFHFINLMQLLLLPFTGLCLAFVSGFFEFWVFSKIIGSASLAVLMVGSLESLKVISILYTTLQDQIFKGNLKQSFRLLQITLLVISMMASTLFLSEVIDRPNLEKLRLEAKDRVERLFDELLEKETEEIENELENLTQNLRKQETILFKDGGGFVGPLYKGYRGEIQNQRVFRQKRYAELNAQREAAIAEVMSREYPFQAANAYLSSFLFVLKDAIDLELKHTQVALFAALLLSFTLELAIFFSLFFFAKTHGLLLRFLHDQSTIQGGLRASQHTMRNPDRQRNTSPHADQPPRPGHARKKYRHQRIIS